MKTGHNKQTELKKKKKSTAIIKQTLTLSAVEMKLTAHYERVKLTTAAWVLHPDVLLVLAGVLVEFTLVAVVLPVAAAHRLLGFALTPEGAHAFRRQAVRRLDAGASIAAGHLRAGVLQGCVK